MASEPLKLLCNKSRMMGDYHVRFRERFGGETPPYLLDVCTLYLLTARWYGELPSVSGLACVFAKSR